MRQRNAKCSLCYLQSHRLRVALASTQRVHTACSGWHVECRVTSSSEVEMPQPLATQLPFAAVRRRLWRQAV